MKIISPISCPPNFGPVEFEPRDGYDDAAFVVTVAGDEVAELAPLTLAVVDILMEDAAAEAALAPEGSWSLTLTRSDDDDFGAHIFIPGDGAEVTPGLTGELAVWATLAMIWARGGEAIGRG